MELTRSDAAWTAKFTRDRYQLASDPKKNLAVMADLAKTSSHDPRALIYRWLLMRRSWLGRGGARKDALHVFWCPRQLWSASFKLPKMQAVLPGPRSRCAEPTLAPGEP